MEYKKPQVSKLVDISKKHGYKNEMFVRMAVYDMFQNNEPITINNVSQRSGATRQSIYSNQELKRLIEYYGKYQQGTIHPNSDDEFWILTNIPRLQNLEKDVDRLLEKNKELNLRLLELNNQIYKLTYSRQMESED